LRYISFGDVCRVVEVSGFEGSKLAELILTPLIDLPLQVVF
jgi:hypothetical protein